MRNHPAGVHPRGDFDIFQIVRVAKTDVIFVLEFKAIPAFLMPARETDDPEAQF